MLKQTTLAMGLLLANTAAYAEDTVADTSLYGWSGHVDADYTSSRGNSNNWAMKGAVDAKRSWQDWDLMLGASARTAASDGERDAEKYTFNGEGRRKLDHHDYVFAQGDYVVDNFSGYDYQATEVVGYGARLYKDDTKEVSAQLGLGGRQSETEAGISTSEVVLKPQANFDWALTDTLSFHQGLASTMGEDFTVTEGTSKLKNALTEQLFLQASYTFTHTSEVPADTHKLDSYTGIGLSYAF